YQNQAYNEARTSRRLKALFGASDHIRHIYNPAARVVNFWQDRLWGGLLDDGAGDGESSQSALPIITENQAIRPPIAKLSADSRWRVGKEVCTLWAACLGSAAIKVVDDTTLGQPRLELVHPGWLKWVDWDPVGNVTGYILQRYVYDPREE